MERFEVPNLVRRDLLMLYYGGDDKTEEAVTIVKAKIKPHLSRAEEKQLLIFVKNWQSQFKKKKENVRRNFNNFVEKEARWLAAPLRLPINFKHVKLPPPATEPEPEDSINFRKPSNYCFMCSSPGMGQCPPYLTRRLSRSICVAMKLESREDMEYEQNLIGCVVCPPCYEKVIEVNDGVKELEQILANLGRISEQVDELLLDGIENHKNVPVEIHGVAPTYLTPHELRKEIVDSRRKTKIGSVLKSPKTGSIPFNTTTRRSSSFQKEPVVDSFSPIIVSVHSVAVEVGPRPCHSSTLQTGSVEPHHDEDAHLRNRWRVGVAPGRGRKVTQTPRQIPPDELDFLPLGDHTYVIPNDNAGELPEVMEVNGDSDCDLDLRHFTPESVTPQSTKTSNGGSFTLFAPDPPPSSVKILLQKKSKESGNRLQLNLKQRPLPLRHFDLRVRCEVAGCGYRCNEVDRLQGHINGVHHNDPKPFKCSYSGCGRMYQDYQALKTHNKFSHGFWGRPFKCDTCHRTYIKADHLRKHVRETHTLTEPSLPCSTCGKIFKSAHRLQYHKRVHQPKSLKCPSITGCPKAFRHMSGLKAHQGKSHPTEFPEFRVEAEPLELMCEECGKLVTSVGLMKRHMSRKHKEGTGVKPRKKHTRKCPVPNCEFKTTKFVELKSHRETHGLVVPTIPCSQPTCSQMFFSKQQQMSHVTKSHNERNRKEFPCERCGRVLATQRSLDMHDEVCRKGGQKDVICDSCNMRFSSLRNLTRHNTSNPNCKPKEEGPRSVYCGTCGALCSSNNTLARHIQLIHNQGKKSFQCASCPKSFPIKMYLTRHLKESKYCPASRGYVPPKGIGPGGTTAGPGTSTIHTPSTSRTD